MKGDVFSEYKYKGDCSLKINMGKNVALGVVYPLFELCFCSN